MIGLASASEVFSELQPKNGAAEVNSTAKRLLCLRSVAKLGDPDPQPPSHVLAPHEALAIPKWLELLDHLHATRRLAVCYMKSFHVYSDEHIIVCIWFFHI